MVKYLRHIGSRESDACWWSGRPGASQTREHLFKSCPAWRQHQKVLWKEVRKQTKRVRDRFRMADLFADECCSKAVLRFLKTTGEDSDASVVDYASEPEEEEEVRRLAEIETELGVLQWMCPGRVCIRGLYRGEPPGGEKTARSEQAEGAGREARCGDGAEARVHGRFLLCVLGRQGEPHRSA